MRSGREAEGQTGVSNRRNQRRGKVNGEIAVEQDGGRDVQAVEKRKARKGRRMGTELWVLRERRILYQH